MFNEKTNYSHAQNQSDNIKLQIQKQKQNWFMFLRCGQE